MTTFNDADYIVVQQAGGPINATLIDLKTNYFTGGGGGGGGGGTWAVVAHAKFTGSPAGGVTAAINTTGANLLVVVETQYSGTAVASVDDSPHNTWSHLTQQINSGSSASVRIAYVISPATSTSHTFSFTGGYGSVEVIAFSKGTTITYDTTSAATGSGGTIQPGSVTPAAANSLLVCGLTYLGTSAASIGSSFTISDQQPFVASTAYGGGLAYFVQTTAAAINPTWTAGGGGSVTQMIVFN